MALGQPTTKVHAFRFSATTTQASVVDTAGETAFKSCRVWNNSATVVYLGGTATIDSTEGYPICTDTASCPEAALTVDGSGLQAESASGSVNLQVICTR